MGSVPTEQAREQRARCLAHRRREAQLAVEDRAVHRLQVARVEGRRADQHLEDESAETPPVDSEAVARPLQHL